MEQTKPLNQNAVKTIAMAAMLANHIATIFLSPGLLREVLLDVGYFTAVTMCYFLVQGFSLTHSKKRYGLRLLLFALLSQIPYSLAFSPQAGQLSFVNFNMLFSLFLCFLLLLSREKLPLARRVGATVGIFFCSFFCDWALLAPFFTLLFAWAGSSRKKTGAAFLLAALSFWLLYFAGGGNSFPPGSVFLYSLGAASGILLAGFVILFLYNGERGRRGQRIFQWGFYLFYPLHLLVLGLLRLCF